MDCTAELAAAAARLARWSAAVRTRRLPSAPPGALATSTCPEALAATDAAALAARRQAGQMSCAKRRRGPTGGYCLKKGHASRGGNSCLSPTLAAALLREAFVGTSPVVLDLGAGVGQYGRYFQEQAPHLRYVHPHPYPHPRPRSHPSPFTPHPSPLTSRPHTPAGGWASTVPRMWRRRRTASCALPT